MALTDVVVDVTVIGLPPFSGVSTNVYRLAPVTGVAMRLPEVGPFALCITMAIAGAATGGVPFGAGDGPLGPALGGGGGLQASMLGSDVALTAPVTRLTPVGMPTQTSVYSARGQIPGVCSMPAPRTHSALPGR